MQETTWRTETTKAISVVAITPQTLKAINYANNTNHTKDLDATSSISLSMHKYYFFQNIAAE